MSLILGSRLVLAAAFTALTIWVSYGRTRYTLKPSMRPLWTYTAVVMGWWAAQYWALAIWPGTSELRIILFHTAPWLTAVLIGTWMWTERAKRG